MRAPAPPARRPDGRLGRLYLAMCVVISVIGIVWMLGIDPFPSAASSAPAQAPATAAVRWLAFASVFHRAMGQERQGCAAAMNPNILQMGTYLAEDRFKLAGELLLKAPSPDEHTLSAATNAFNDEELQATNMAGAVNASSLALYTAYTARIHADHRSLLGIQRTLRQRGR